MSETIKLTEDQFWEQFKPIKNKLDKNASYDGHMFETFGDELEFVQAMSRKKPLTVWTITDCDGTLVIGEGYHYVNRMGYLITKVPAQADTQYIIEDDFFELITETNTETIASICLPEIIGDYGDPIADSEEWQWLEKNASFSNKKDGAFEFLLNMSLEFDDLPWQLEDVFSEAKTKNIAYLIFHQGT